jgi:vacuolar-type H+-ATPase subunit C/Vma6
MAGAGRYAELAAAVRSFKAELIRSSQVERFIESASLSEVVNLLTKGRVAYVEGDDLSNVEVFLTQQAKDLAERLAAYSPHDSRSLIKLFSAWYELECVKGIIRSIADQIQPEEAARHIVPAGKFTEERCKELIEGRNLNRVVEMLDDQALKAFLAPRLTSEKSAASSVFAVDQYYYTRLWNASNLPDPLDAQSARSLIGELIDHLNVLLAFRTRLIGLDARSTLALMIPVNYALGRSFSELAEGANIQSLMRVLEKTPYAKALQVPSLVDENVASIELALNRSHAVACLNAFAGSPFNVGLALALLFLKNYELRDLFSIINGKANNASAERVLNSLILRGP